jgi:hypothetical protein
MKCPDEIIGDISFEQAQYSDLSQILQLEWANFSKYQHVFNATKIQVWFEHNPKMFYIAKDANKNIFGYAIVVPMEKELYNDIIIGKYSSLIDFPKEGVKMTLESDYYHIEVIATVPVMKKSCVAGTLLKGIGNIIYKYAKYVTTSPMADVGKKLSNYFGFKIISQEKYKGEIYPIALLEINSEGLKKLNIF